MLVFKNIARIIIKIFAGFLLVILLLFLFLLIDSRPRFKKGDCIRFNDKIWKIARVFPFWTRNDYLTWGDYSTQVWLEKESKWSGGFYIFAETAKQAASIDCPESTY